MTGNTGQYRKYGQYGTPALPKYGNIGVMVVHSGSCRLCRSSQGLTQQQQNELGACDGLYRPVR